MPVFFVPETSLDATLQGSETSGTMTFKLRLGILKLMKHGHLKINTTPGSFNPLMEKYRCSDFVI